MKKNTIYLTIFLILAGFNIILIAQVYYTPEDDTALVNKPTVVNLSLPDSALNEIKAISSKSNDIQIDSTLILISAEGKELALYDIIDKLPILVFNFQNYSCKVCIDDELDRLKLAADEIGAKNVIAIGSFSTQREQFVTEKNFGLKTYSFKQKNFKLPVDNLYQAYLFVIDRNWETSGVYVPVKDLSSMSDIFYSIVINKHFAE